MSGKGISVTEIANNVNYAATDEGNARMQERISTGELKPLPQEQPNRDTVCYDGGMGESESCLVSQIDDKEPIPTQPNRDTVCYDGGMDESESCLASKISKKLAEELKNKEKQEQADKGKLENYFNNEDKVKSSLARFAAKRAY